MSNPDEPVTAEQIDDNKLITALAAAFNDTELNILCIALEIELGIISPGSMETRATSLVIFCRQHDRSGDLAGYIRRVRPRFSAADLCKDVTPTSPPPPSSPPSQPPRHAATFEFVNRIYELDCVCRPGGSRFKLIDGAAGYGKTRLLGKIKETFESSTHEKWRAGYVDLKRHPAMSAGDLPAAKLSIARAVIAGFPSARSARRNSKPSSDGEIINRLVEHLCGLDANIVLLWDSIDVLPQPTGTWLKQMVYELDQGLKSGRQKLVVVFSGRYVGDWERDAPYPITAIHLSPFDYAVVQEMIELRAAAAHRLLEPAYLDDLTWHVLYVSGGHPKGICCLLDRIAKAGFIFRDLHNAFFVQKFHHAGSSGTLFQLCIEPIIKELTGDLSPWLQDAFRSLSPVRRYNRDILDHFMRMQLFTPPAGAGADASWDLLRDLLRTHMLRPPTLGDPMYSDQILRRMLAVQLQVTNRTLFEKVNAEAQVCFDNWASSRDGRDAQTWRTAVVESLYHTLQPEANGTGPANSRDTVMDLASRYLEQAKDEVDLHQLNDALARDQELKDLIARRTGSDTVRHLGGLITGKLSA